MVSQLLNNRLVKVQKKNIKLHFIVSWISCRNILPQKYLEVF